MLVTQVEPRRQSGRYLRDYSHWGYIDVDTLVANLSQWVLPADLRTFDVITWASRPKDECWEAAVYAGGQLTIYRNKPRVSALWRRNPCWAG